MYRNWFIYKAERCRVRLLLYFKWIIYSEEEALAASPYLQHLVEMEAAETALLTPAARQISLVRRSCAPALCNSAHAV